MDMAAAGIVENDMNFKATELRLGLPGREDESEQHSSSSSSLKSSNKRSSSEMAASCHKDDEAQESCGSPVPKAQVVGWPPVRSFRKGVLHQQKKAESDENGMFVKVSLDGAPYLRKIDLKFYKNYFDLVKGLESMFKCAIGAYSGREGYSGSKYVPTYEDKDGDWMLVGDVPWDMFVNFCKRLRIMKGSEAKGLGSL